MNKMTKGALSIGLGAALLLGGGGTLATWNATASVAPGTIVAGDLNIEAKAEKGVWTNSVGTIDIKTYRVVPGDVITFTQDLDVTLTGDKLTAALTHTTANPTTSFKGGSLPPVIELSQVKDGKQLTLDPAKLTAANSGVITAKAVFTFKDTNDRIDANQTLNLGTTTFSLKQNAVVK